MFCFFSKGGIKQKLKYVAIIIVRNLICFRDVAFVIFRDKALSDYPQSLAHLFTALLFFFKIFISEILSVSVNILLCQR